MFGTALALAACSTSSSSAPAGSSGSSGSTGGATNGHTIVIKNFTFMPGHLTVAPGTVITVVNKDATIHTLTATKGASFNTGDIQAGQSKTFTAPKTAGTYPYFCMIHQYMTGTLTVS